MITQFNRSMKATIGMTAAMAALMMASCVSTRSSSPQQVDASNPTVTYKYRDDNELIEANQRAINFCTQYQALPQAQTFALDTDGRNIVVFECVPAASLPVVQIQIREPNADLRYDYRTDQELLDLSRNAQVYCLNSGAPEMESNIEVNANGSKTVTFRCSPR
jgi:hypothetical protein